MRYNAEGRCDMNDKSRTTIGEAREKLHKLNAHSWRKRIDAGLRSQKNAIRDLRALFWGIDRLPDDLDELQKETIVAIPQRPALMAMAVSDLNVVIDKPSFALSEIPQYLHRIGKGMPLDMQYSLLLPMSWNIGMGEVRMNLRDYPLPLFHVPALKSGSSKPAFFLKADFVIAEEFRDVESTRRVDVEVVPPGIAADGKEVSGFYVPVRRTVSPVKTYSEMNIDINTAAPTRMTWGTSYQPAIQDMMQVVESFTKPPVDPSERVGFWDKIRLTFHSRINLAWKGDGDVHLILKGT